MDSDGVLRLYLGLLFLAWKKGYKLGWIYYQMLVTPFNQEAVHEFFASAQEKGYPLVADACHAKAGTPYFLATVNKGFSDWMYRVDPDVGKFIKNALANSRSLQVSKAKWSEASRDSAEDLRQRGWEALDAFGGEVKDLKGSQLVYDTRGRRTGRGMSERTWKK